MKLCNKKTGEIVEVFKVGLVWNKYGMPFDLGQYKNLAELNEEWEDYESTEPLIKDPKIRKAVRAWAESNDIDRVWHECSTCWLRGNGLEIYFDELELEQGNYTITELCGEENSEHRNNRRAD